MCGLHPHPQWAEWGPPSLLVALLGVSPPSFWTDALLSYLYPFRTPSLSIRRPYRLFAWFVFLSTGWLRLQFTHSCVGGDNANASRRRDSWGGEGRRLLNEQRTVGKWASRLVSRRERGGDGSPGPPSQGSPDRGGAGRGPRGPSRRVPAPAPAPGRHILASPAAALPSEPRRRIPDISSAARTTPDGCGSWTETAEEKITGPLRRWGEEISTPLRRRRGPSALEWITPRRGWFTTSPETGRTIPRPPGLPSTPVHGSGPRGKGRTRELLGAGTVWAGFPGLLCEAFPRCWKVSGPRTVWGRSRTRRAGRPTRDRSAPVPQTSHTLAAEARMDLVCRGGRWVRREGPNVREPERGREGARACGSGRAAHT